ncbi:hypothetical protein CPB85DRAFT_1437948 [Mucidula mucida]|nr:hypothetical protein CPB85DRAFT_1437948 [Mucidula mucida]
MTHTKDVLKFDSPDADVVYLVPRVAVLQRHCTESRAVLFALLQFIYPVPNPHIATLDELVPVIEAARKFQLDYLVDELGLTLTDERLGFVKDAPLRVYAIATRFAFKEAMRVAAKGTLRYNVLDCPLNEDLKNINAYDYHRLLDLHRRQVKATQEARHNPGLGQCYPCGYKQEVASWWTKFVELVNVELSERPSADTIFTHRFIAAEVEASVASCNSCLTHAFRSSDALDVLKKR